MLSYIIIILCVKFNILLYLYVFVQHFLCIISLIINYNYTYQSFEKRFERIFMNIALRSQMKKWFCSLCMILFYLLWIRGIGNIDFAN